MITIIPNWHPILVHFTIGLLSISVLFYFAGSLLPNEHKWKEQWHHTANWSLWTGCLFTVVTMVAGWYAYNTVAHDSASHAAMTLHRNWAILTALLFIIIGISAIGLSRKNNKPSLLFLSTSAIAAIMLMVTGWLGAEAVYRYGLGVMSLPTIELGVDGHDHDHNKSEDSERPETHPHADKHTQSDQDTSVPEPHYDDAISHDDGHHH